MSAALRDTGGLGSGLGSSVGAYMFWAAREQLCRSPAINIITQFGKCQSNKTFPYTPNSL